MAPEILTIPVSNKVSKWQTISKISRSMLPRMDFSRLWEIMKISSCKYFSRNSTLPIFCARATSSIWQRRSTPKTNSLSSKKTSKGSGSQNPPLRAAEEESRWSVTSKILKRGTRNKSNKRPSAPKHKSTRKSISIPKTEFRSSRNI